MKILEVVALGSKNISLILRSPSWLRLSLLLLIAVLLAILSLPTQGIDSWYATLYATQYSAPYSAQSAFAQPATGVPVEITEFEDGILVEWNLPPEIRPDPDAAELFQAFIEAGWAIDLLEDVLVPSYTIPLWESPLEEGERGVPSEEIVALVDILASVPITMPIEAKEMPTLMSQSGDRLPFVSPLAAPETLLPTQPAYLLREAMVRGQRQFVFAISPIFREGDEIRLATAGMATLVGVTSSEHQPGLGQDVANQAAGNIDAEESPAQRKEEQTVVTPPPANTGQTALIPPANAGGSAVRPLTSPLESPLAQPQAGPPQADQPQTVPLNSPLPTPTTVPEAALQQDQGEEPNEDQTLATQTTEAVQPTEVSDEPPLAEERQPRAALMPWTGLLTFLFFGFGLLYVLFSREA